MRLFFSEHPSPLIRGSSHVAPYNSLYGNQLKRAKYGSNLPVMKTLAKQFASTVSKHRAFQEVDCIVPVPSPWTRRLKRGFCAASVLASAASTELELPVYQALKLKPGQKQAGLHQQERQANLRHRLFSRRAARGHVLLIDDVLTTGTTSHQAAVELLGEASMSVTLLTLCAVTTESNLLASLPDAPSGPSPGGF